MDAAVPRAEAFFASRAGVCVYVTIRGHTVRVCFESLDAGGHTGADDSPGIVEEAITVATTAFRTHRAVVAPLFDMIPAGGQAESK